MAEFDVRIYEHLQTGLHVALCDQVPGLFVTHVSDDRDAIAEQCMIVIPYLRVTAPGPTRDLGADWAKIDDIVLSMDVEAETGEE